MKKSAFDYEHDRFGKACLKEAKKSKSNLGFGAVLVRNGRIIGRGRNRWPTVEERRLLSHVDYAIHAEQACVADALLRSHKVAGSAIYVLGMVLHGTEKGKLTIRDSKVFVCKKCPLSVLLKFNISVNIPHKSGWVRLSPEIAMRTAKKLCGKGYWDKFISGVAR